MRKIEFNELKLKNPYDEETFFQFYIENLSKESKDNSSIAPPSKQYEIFYLNILGGKLILLNTAYIKNNNYINRDLYFDYNIAFEIYNHLLDIYDGIESEMNEYNELYKGERLEIDNKINKLREKDNELFIKSLNNHSKKFYTNLEKRINNGDKKW